MKKLLFIATFYKRFCIVGFLSLFSFLSCTQTQPESGIRPASLTCEYMTNPSVVDALNPRLSWINNAVNPDEIEIGRAHV